MKTCIKVLMILALILMTGCGDGSGEDKLPKLPTSNVVATDGKVDVDVYLDATVSMQGFTTLAAGNVYRALPDLLDELGNSMGTVKFYSFGAKIQPLEGRDYRRFTTPAPYVETITAIANVVDAADTSHLSIVVTDLFESDADWSNVVNKIRDKFFKNDLALGVIGIKNSFSGKIFDVGLNAVAFDYDSYDYDYRFRPFYLLLMGKESDVRDFMEKFKERQTLPNATEYLLLVKNLSALSNKLAEQEILEMDNLFREDKFKVTDEGVRELGIKSLSDPATLRVQFKREVPLGACPFTPELIGNVKIFTPAQNDWQPSAEKEFSVKVASPTDEEQSPPEDVELYAELKPVEETDDVFTLKLIFVPDRVLNREEINLMNVSVSPTSKSYKLPDWVAKWSMPNVDVAPNEFDGSKTINLTRVLGSLKDSLYSTESPNLINLHFVLYER